MFSPSKEEVEKNFELLRKDLEGKVRGIACGVLSKEVEKVKMERVREDREFIPISLTPQPLVGGPH